MPQQIRTGRKRSESQVREGNWARLNEDEIDSLAGFRRLGEGGARLQREEDPRGYGTQLEGFGASGVILEALKGFFVVRLLERPVLPAGWLPLPEVLAVRARGSLKNFDLGISGLAAVGDVIEMVVPPVAGDRPYEGVLTQVRERSQAFRRLHPSGRAIQTLAANVDQVLIVASAAQPDFRPGFVDRVLACAEASGLRSLIVVNKLDLGLRERDTELLEVYRRLDYPVLLTSVVGGQGLEALRKELVGKRSVFCGHSGVGKSSLLNRLEPGLEDQIRVGVISSYTGKGCHTTTHARLYRLPDCEVIDTPGVREFTPADTDRKNLWAWFPEIRARKAQCAFDDCTHTVEEGCAVRKARDEGLIHPRRYDSYVRILETLPY